MPSNRSFRIITRLAFFEGAIIISLIMYILELKSVISSTVTWPLATFFVLIEMILLGIVDRKQKNSIR